MDRVPLLNAGSARMGRGVPARILVHPDEVGVRTLRPPRRTTQRVRYDQVAQVSVVRRVVFVDLAIETRGEGIPTLAGMAKANAEEARALIQGQPGIPEPPGTALSAPPDIPEQIRKLAKFRDAGF